ncbi:alpha/beta fold hydrolase [Nonomuraea sp. NPDC050451]|uniref:alpha/beta fold hydrolase n=1 Tax=Nonomuraea sp. NPDC050451 TaxID=3364364 RepID=UPI0037A38A68
MIHGAEDALCDPSGGRATAAAIPGAELVVIDGMGHDLPKPLWPDLASHIATLAHRTDTLASTEAFPA